jgi:uncharacterized protein (UPF0332 family)
MNARDFLTVADRLLQGTTEAEWRSALSRAYYAAFHVGLELLTACGFVVPARDRAHAFVWIRLANSGHAAVNHAGNGLRSLRGDRNWADYDLARPLAPAVVAQRVQAAKAIVRALEAAGQDPLKSQITAAIRVYERDVLRKVTWRP